MHSDGYSRDSVGLRNSNEKSGGGRAFGVAGDELDRAEPSGCARPVSSLRIFIDAIHRVDGKALDDLQQAPRVALG